MKKAEFMKALVQKINRLPQEEIDKSLCFYDEMINDRMEDGMLEDEAVAALGSVDDIAATILFATPISQAAAPASGSAGTAGPNQFGSAGPSTAQPSPSPAVPQKASVNKWLIVLLIILSCPIWLPVICTVGGLLIGLVATIFGLTVALFAILFSLGATAIGLLCGSVAAILTGNVASGLCQLGACLICGGLLLLLWKPVAALCKLAWSGVKTLWHKLLGLIPGSKHPQQPVPAGNAAKEVLHDEI